MSDYSADEIMTISAARMLPNGATCFVGIGLPSDGRRAVPTGVRLAALRPKPRCRSGHCTRPRRVNCFWELACLLLSLTGVSAGQVSF